MAKGPLTTPEDGDADDLVANSATSSPQPIGAGDSDSEKAALQFASITKREEEEKNKKNGATGQKTVISSNGYDYTVVFNPKGNSIQIADKLPVTRQGMREDASQVFLAVVENKAYSIGKDGKPLVKINVNDARLVADIAAYCNLHGYNYTIPNKDHLKNQVIFDSKKQNEHWNNFIAEAKQDILTREFNLAPDAMQRLAQKGTGIDIAHVAKRAHCMRSVEGFKNTTPQHQTKLVKAQYGKDYTGNEKINNVLEFFNRGLTSKRKTLQNKLKDKHSDIAKLTDITKLDTPLVQNGAYTGSKLLSESGLDEANANAAKATSTTSIPTTPEEFKSSMKSMNDFFKYPDFGHKKKLEEKQFDLKIDTSNLLENQPKFPGIGL